MSGVDVSVCNSVTSGSALAADAPIAPVASGSGTFAIAVPWTDSGQARLVALALREGMEARVTDEAFTKDGHEFPRGTVVFTSAANGDSAMELLLELANYVGANIVALDSSWVEKGPNLGSDAFVTLTLPKIAMLWDEGTNPLSAGALRFVLERRLGLPVVPIRTRSLSRADLADYDVLVVPEGAPAGVLGQAGLATIGEFARKGGVVVAIGASLGMLTTGENPLLAVKREAALGREPDKADAGKDAKLAKGQEIASEADYRKAIQDERALPDTLPGALLNTVADRENFLSAGYDEGAVVMASGSQIYTPLDRADGINVMRFAEADNLIASGYVWDENRRQLAFKPYLMAQPSGDGLTIGFAHDPSSRAYLDGLDLLLANAVMVAPSRVR